MSILNCRAQSLSDEDQGLRKMEDFKFLQDLEEFPEENTYEAD